MQFFARRVECGHIIWAGPLVNTAATVQTADELRGRRCPTCHGVTRKVGFVTFETAKSPFDVPPAPRNTENKLKKVSNADVKKTRQRLAGLGAETEGLATTLKESALELAPREWRGALAKIPVASLRTFEPNAECITFRGSAMPAIVFHQGLAGYLFKMNRSVLPLIRTASLNGAVTSFVKDPKTRAALQIQAVDTALEFLGVGEPRSKAMVEIPPVAKFLEMALTRTMSSFVLCHEYGHAVLNHADELRSVGSDSQVYLLERSRAMEFEADTWGQDAVIGAFTGGRKLEATLDVLDDLFSTDATLLKQDISLASPCLTLLYFEFLDMVENRLARHGIDVGAPSAASDGYRRRARGDSPTAPDHSDHPSNQERFEALYAHLAEHANFTAHAWVEAFEALLEGIKDDLDRLIDKTGAIQGTRLTHRFQWPRRKVKSEPAARRASAMTRLDDDTRIKLQEVMREAESEGSSLTLDEAELSRYFDDQKKRASAHFEKQEYAKAEAVYTRILDYGETTESVQFYPLLGMCREKIGDVEGAIAAYRRCLEIVPGSEPAALCGFSLGRILKFDARYDKNDPDGAELALTAATTARSPDIRLRAMHWLGVIAQDRHDVDTALRWYRKVWAERDAELRMCPAVPAYTATNMGNALKDRGQFKEAARMYEYARDHPAIEPENRAIAEQLLRDLPGR